MVDRALLIIPARGGSKGILRKNMQLIGGHPMLEFTLRAAAGVEIPDARAVCTTDDKEMQMLALSLGVEAPFLRPAQLAQDRSSIADAVRHALDWYAGHENFIPEWIVLLQPTSPFRGTVHIENALSRIMNSDHDCLFGVNPVTDHPCDYLLETDTGFNWVMQRPKKEGREFFPDVWFLNGAIYITRTRYFERTHWFYDQQAMLYPMSKWEGVDIDTQEDLDFANWVYERHIRHINQYPFRKMI